MRGKKRAAFSEKESSKKALSDIDPSAAQKGTSEKETRCVRERGADPSTNFEYYLLRYMGGGA